MKLLSYIGWTFLTFCSLSLLSVATLLFYCAYVFHFHPGCFVGMFLGSFAFMASLILAVHAADLRDTARHDAQVEREHAAFRASL